MLPAAGARPPEAFSELLELRAPAFGISLEPSAARKLARFLAELDRARRLTNLTGPLTAEQLVDHALESVLGGCFIAPRSQVVDIGSGGGFPAIPLALARSDISVTAVEPRRKRLDFLSGVSERVGIHNLFAAETSLSRVADGLADVATARAVGRIDRILRNAPFLKAGGLLLAWTTGRDADRLSLRIEARFHPEARLRVPESRDKVIAPFRKVVPRGTGRG